MTHAHIAFSDSTLFAAYLQQDMTIWQQYIEQADWQKSSAKERLRIVNYEYGFIAAAIDDKNPKAQQYLDDFNAHLEQLYSAKQLTEARYKMYLSSACAYDYMLHKSRLFTSGMQSFKLVKEAAKLAPKDPYVLSLKANVDFYAPSAFGGDKEHALDLFLQALKIFESMPEYRTLWNYAAARLCVAQCYDKLGQKEEAIRTCKTILRDIPDFLFVKDYLKQLEGKK